jgi:O-antigen ligase
MEHPGEVYDVVGDHGILIGGGILGGGGAFGIESAQAHNSFFDLLFSGGVLFLVLFLFILYELLRYYYLKKSSLNKIEANNSLVIFYFLFLYLIHMPFNSGGVFHPNHSILFWIFILANLCNLNV